RGEVLAFVDQDQALLEAATANVVERLELQRHALEDVLDAAMGVFVVHVQGFEVVGDRPQPGLHFFRFGARQEADFLVQPLHAAGGDDAPIALADHGLLDGCGQCQDGLARTCGTGEVDQVDVGVEQGEQRQALMDVTRFQAPGFLVQQWLLMQVEQQQLAVTDALDPADEALLVDDELVDVNRRQVVGQLHAVP
uniref:Nitrogenase iron protein n=1 Tax=Steinernema glaseri TaxID=37863 RepID=A0A1I7XWQ0_9BILA